jgi:hypothetical protein
LSQLTDNAPKMSVKVLCLFFHADFQAQNRKEAFFGGYNGIAFCIWMELIEFTFSLSHSDLIPM